MVSGKAPTSRLTAQEKLEETMYVPSIDNLILTQILVCKILELKLVVVGGHYRVL